jgi:hypothetical protein
VNIEIRGSGFSAKSSDFLPPKRTMNAGCGGEKLADSLAPWQTAYPIFLRSGQLPSPLWIVESRRSNFSAVRAEGEGEAQVYFEKVKCLRITEFTVKGQPENFITRQRFMFET